MEDAACLGVDADLFFPKLRRGRKSQTRPIRDTEAAAKAVCATCPVKAECLEYSVHPDNDLTHRDSGIWAGTTYRERKAIQRQRAQKAAS